MIVILCIAIVTIVIARTTRPRTLVVRETPVCSYLPRDIGVPTCWRRKP